MSSNTIHNMIKKNIGFIFPIVNDSDDNIATIITNAMVADRPPATLRAFTQKIRVYPCPSVVQVKRCWFTIVTPLNIAPTMPRYP